MAACRPGTPPRFKSRWRRPAACSPTGEAAPPRSATVRWRRTRYSPRRCGASWAFRAEVARPRAARRDWPPPARSEEHTSELQSRLHLVCRLLLEKKKIEQALTAIGRFNLAPPPRIHATGLA